jgi:hypothetical protein
MKLEYKLQHKQNDDSYRYGRIGMGEYLKIKRNIERMERELEFMMKE